MTTTPTPFTPARLDELRRERDYEAAVEQEAPTSVPACPSWCVEPDGHAYDGGLGWPVTFSRIHRSTDREVSVQQLEEVTGGALSLDTPGVYVRVEQDWTDPQDAREHARQVLQAAALLTQIQQGHDERGLSELCSGLDRQDVADVQSIVDAVRARVVQDLTVLTLVLSPDEVALVARARLGVAG